MRGFIKFWFVNDCSLAYCPVYLLIKGRHELNFDAEDVAKYI